MRKKRIMIIGARNCGKTLLANRLNGLNIPLRKVQDTIYAGYTIDVPSAYIENAWMYMHTIALSQDASCILLLIDQSRPAMIYSPGFARVFRCPVVGVISKSDLAEENAAACETQLRQIGIDPPLFHISNETGEGIDELKSYLRRRGWMQQAELI